MESEDGDGSGSAAADRADDDSKDHGGGESKTNGGMTNDDGEKKPLPLALPLETPSPSSTKGKGLKKWRRIQRRDIAKEAATTTPEDLNRFLKRDSSGGSAFALVADSDNSEDPSSKSSTAASAPKFRYHHRNSTSNRSPTLPTRNNYNNTSARYSQPGGRQNNKTETTKKPRGGVGVKIDKDASYSSVESSDLRSSNVFFTEISNGRHISFDVDNSSEAQASDQQSNEYFFKDNGEEEVVSQDDDPAADASWEAKEEQSDIQPPSRHLLAESIILLQDVHQALEKEIKKFREIGKEPIWLPDELNEPAVVSETKSSSEVPFEEEFIKIQRKVEILEREVEEAMSMLEVKERRVVELEGILLLLNERGELAVKGGVGGEEEKCREMERELDGLFKLKIEAEVECLMMRKTAQKLSQIALVEEQKSQNKIVRDTQSNIASSGEDGDGIVKNLHIRKHTFCFSAQFMLLILAFGLLVSQLWPASSGFVPT